MYKFIHSFLSIFWLFISNQVPPSSKFVLWKNEWSGSVVIILGGEWILIWCLEGSNGYSIYVSFASIEHRTPLCVAAGTGAGSVVVKVLVDAYSRACLVQDTDGRLQLICHVIPPLNYSKTTEEVAQPCCQARDTLLSLHRCSYVIVEDKDSMSAIEYAWCSDAEHKTVGLLQKDLKGDPKGLRSWT